MNNQYSFLFTLPLLLLITAILTLYPDRDVEQEKTTSAGATINAVIGNESYIATFGERPDNSISDHIRIKTHLTYIERLLRERPTDHLSDQQRQNRLQNLSLLREYIQAGQFPYNDGHSDFRRPTFIDQKRNICAVGFLVKKTAGHDIVESINRDYKYAYISEIDDPFFKRWAENSGFTMTELAMIQPAYDGGDDDNTENVIKNNENHIRTDYGAGSALLASATMLYLSNRVQDPWLLPSSSATHWLGLAAGTGSAILGALNLDNRKTYSVPVCGTVPPCWENVYKQSNHLRTGLSITNIGIGLVNVIRSTYHLFNKSQPMEAKRPSKKEIELTHLQPGSTPVGEPVPALQFRYNF